MVEDPNDAIVDLHALSARINALEKAQDLFREEITRVPTAVDRAAQSIKESIELRFAERDLRFKQGSEDSKLAVRAALETANQAITKLELTFSTQNIQLSQRLGVETSALAQRINDLKESARETKGEKSGSSSVIQMVLAIIGAVGVLGLIIVDYIRK